MKRIFTGLFFAAAFFLAACTTAKNVQGSFSGTVYGDELKINLASDQRASVIINGEAFEATYLVKDGIIEVWQNRKTPPFYFKLISDNQLALLNDQKQPTDVVLKKQ